MRYNYSKLKANPLGTPVCVCSRIHIRMLVYVCLDKCFYFRHLKHFQEINSNRQLTNLLKPVCFIFSIILTTNFIVELFPVISEISFYDSKSI